MEVLTTLVKFFQEGGLFMYPISLVLAIGIAIAVERYLYLSYAKVTNRSMWQKLTPLLRANNYVQAMALSSKSKADIGKILLKLEELQEERIAKALEARPEREAGAPDHAPREQDLRDHLGGFGFAGDQALMPSGAFSGGEKSRLVLALLVYQRPNLLLLDEPTNHLDLEMRQALAVALQDFAGAVVLVSHDRHLLRVTVDRLVLVYDGRVDDFAGSLDDYPGWLAEQNRQARVSSRDSTAVTSAAARKDRKRQEAEQRRQLQPLRKKIRAAEATLAQLHARQEQLQQSLADPAVYADAEKAQLKALLLEKAELDNRCEALEMQWLQDCERLETLQVGDLP